MSMSMTKSASSQEAPLSGLRTGAAYRESLRDGREVWLDGERVKDVASHPAFRPIVDVRARMYDLALDRNHQDRMTYLDQATNTRRTILNKLPWEQGDWDAKRNALETVFHDIGGIVNRVGDETVAAMWTMYDARDQLRQVNPQFAENVERHMQRILDTDPYHVSGNADPKGNRSLRPQDQDPDMMLHVVKETDAGIYVVGAKYETGSAYANQAFVKVAGANWGDAKLSDYAIGFILDGMVAPGLKHLCRSAFSDRKHEDYPLSAKFDEVDALVIFDNVFIPWENVLFYRDTSMAALVRATVHRYSAYPFLTRMMFFVDLLIGTVLHNLRQTGLENNPIIREKLTSMACFREMINAHLTAAVTKGKRSPAGLFMPDQSLLFAGRALACARLHEIVHIARELCGGQICLTPAYASFAEPGAAEWLDKYYTLGEQWQSEDRRKLLAFARDLINSDYAAHKLCFYLFGHSPPYIHLELVYRNFDFDGPLDFVRKAASLSGRVGASKTAPRRS
jgi:4-hydroxyphenylacetate 3-monooxygenase